MIRKLTNYSDYQDLKTVSAKNEENMVFENKYSSLLAYHAYGKDKNSIFQRKKPSIECVVRIRPTIGSFNTGGKAAQTTDSLISGDNNTIQVINEKSLIFDPFDKCIPEFSDFADNKFNTFNSAGAIQSKKRCNTPPPCSNDLVHKSVQYNFEKIFKEDSTQLEVFNTTIRSSIGKMTSGHSPSLITYGSTGCGKIYTAIGTKQNPGLVFLSMKEIFSIIQSIKSDYHIGLSVSYYEVYMGKIVDLFAPIGSTQKPRALANKKNECQITDLTRHTPNNMNDLISKLDEANRKRKTECTSANGNSSRSHAVLSLELLLASISNSKVEPIISSGLNIIDLAGSERAWKGSNIGKRMAEEAQINLTYLALAKCINSLNDENPNKHIPYRESILTRVIQAALGNSSKFVMIACVSPLAKKYFDTHSTLEYANKFRDVNKFNATESQCKKKRPLCQDSPDITNNISDVNFKRIKIYKRKSMAFSKPSGSTVSRVFTTNHRSKKQRVYSPLEKTSIGTGVDRNFSLIGDQGIPSQNSYRPPISRNEIRSTKIEKNYEFQLKHPSGGKALSKLKGTEWDEFYQGLEF
ncbi:Kinesin-like protein 5 [Smittium mucronatum]|uniref:Kinesin-like protein 5 n=1 Tax=Smittium mucronatum TaxID=133383 RepID=A0A1R0H4S4_9FUNG|nr:Kinesin-like protein 5 [Smittium mucronatum]